MMHIGIAADHGGFELKSQLTVALIATGYEVDDFGAHELITEDDYLRSSCWERRLGVTNSSPYC